MASRPVSLWKRVAIRAAVGGSSFAITLAVGMAILLTYSKRPKAWDDISLKATEARPESIILLGGTGADRSGFSFELDVQNTSSADLALPVNASIFSQTRTTNSLKLTSLKLEREYFIPARHSMTITLADASLCVADLDPRKCYEVCFGGSESLVILDQTARLKVTARIPLVFERPGDMKSRKVDQNGDPLPVTDNRNPIK